VTDIIEAAARALREIEDNPNDVPIWGGDYRYTAERVLAAVAPLIRAAALEEAAALIETYGEDYPSEGDWLMRGDVAAKLRAMKEQP
jgi:hypothetical protein